jgi:hypothetical protein
MTEATAGIGRDKSLLVLDDDASERRLTAV